MPKAKKKQKQHPVQFGARDITGNIALAFLAVGLCLAAYNLSLTVRQSGSFEGLQDSLSLLETNYSAVLTTAEPQPVAKPMPAVLFSVVKFREGEEASLRMHLVGPLIARSLDVGPELSAVLFERKNAGSRDVLVREFRADGTEASYLWPSTHADANGFWVPQE